MSQCIVQCGAGKKGTRSEAVGVDRQHHLPGKFDHIIMFANLLFGRSRMLGQVDKVDKVDKVD